MHYLLIIGPANRFSAGSDPNPIHQQEGANEEWKNPIQCVTRRVRMPIDGPKHRQAEEHGQQNDNDTGNRNRDVKPTETFEPVCLHTRIVLSIASCHAAIWGTFARGVEPLAI